MEVEELRSWEPWLSFVPIISTPGPTLVLLSSRWYSLARGEGGELLGRGMEGTDPHCCVSTLALPSLGATASPAVAIVRPLYPSQLGFREAQPCHSSQLTARSLTLLPSLGVCGSFSLPQCPHL